MDVKPLTPKNPFDRKEVQSIFDDYKRQKQAPIAPEPVKEKLTSGEVTIAVSDVPSKMLPYPKGSSIKFKPYTYGDLQIFNSSSLSDEDRVKFILDGIITSGFDKSLLAFQDFLFIAILRKLTAFNHSKFTYNFICEECGKVNEQTAELSSIEFKDLEIPSLPVIVDVYDDVTLMINPLTIGSSLKLKDVEKDRYLRAYAECVINMKSEEAYNVLRNASGETISVLEEVDSLLGFGQQSIDCKCSSCKKDQTFRLGEIQAILGPFRGENESYKSRIRFS